MSHIHKLGARVALKSPLPGEPRGPWKVLGVKLNTAPPVYNLLHQGPGKARKITAEEGELLGYSDAPMLSRQVNP